MIRTGKNGKMLLKRRGNAKKTNAQTHPVMYSQTVVNKICKALIEGNSLIAISQRDRMPSLGTIYKWLKTYPEFEKAYRNAKMLQMDSLGERLLDISNEYEDVQRARLMSDNIKWLMSKVAPTKYGNRLALAGHSTESARISVTYVKSPNMNTEN